MQIKACNVGFINTNCYFLMDEETKKAAVVDPGDCGEQLYDFITKEGYQPVMILLTHGHFDHVDGVRPFLERSGSIPVYIHQKDYPYSPTGFGLSASGDGLGMMDEAVMVKEGDEIQLGTLTIKVLETPGHTGGGVTYMVNDVLFTGDTLFAGACGRTDFSNSNPADMLSSLRRLAMLEGDYQVLPGHMGASTLARERRSNPYIRQALGTR